MTSNDAAEAVTDQVDPHAARKLTCQCLEARGELAHIGSWWIGQRARTDPGVPKKTMPHRFEYARRSEESVEEQHRMFTVLGAREDRSNVVPEQPPLPEDS